MGKALDNIQRQIEALEQERSELGRIPVGPALSPSAIRLPILERELAQLYLDRDKQLDVEEGARQQVEAATAAAREQIEGETRNFWLRRFITTLAIANAAALTGIAAGLSQADNPGILGPHLAGALRAFATGMIAAGSMPLIFYANGLVREFMSAVHRRRIREASLFAGLAAQIVLTALSIVCLLVGLMQLVGVVDGLS